MFNSYVSLPEGTPCNSRIFPLKAPWLVGDSQEIATFYHISRWYFPVFRCISMYFHISPWYHDSSQYTMILPMIFPWYSHDRSHRSWYFPWKLPIQVGYHGSSATQTLVCMSTLTMKGASSPGELKKTSLVDDQKVGFQIHDIHGIRIVKHREIFESYLHCTLVDDDLMKPWVTTASLVPLGMIIVQSGNRQMPRGISA